MPRKTADGMPSGVKITLLALSEAVQLLPRELRDMVFGYVFDPNTTALAHRQMFRPTKLGHLMPHSDYSQWWPKYLQPSLVDRNTHLELVEYFFKHNTRFQARDTNDLKILLGRDLYNSGLCLSSVAIHSFTLSLKVEGYEEPEELWDRVEELFSMLVGTGQRFARKFALEIRLETDLAPKTSGRDPFETLWHRGGIENMVEVLRELHPNVRKVQNEVTEMEPSSKVVFMVAFMPNGDEDLVVEVQEEMLELSGIQWVDFLARQMESVRE